MKMKNIIIFATDSTHITVYADTERFGEHEIMYQCGSFDEAYDYIKRETGRQTFLMTASCLASAIEDWTGKIGPAYAYVID